MDFHSGTVGVFLFLFQIKNINIYIPYHVIADFLKNHTLHAKIFIFINIYINNYIFLIITMQTIRFLSKF